MKIDVEMLQKSTPHFKRVRVKSITSKKFEVSVTKILVSEI
jgi:hypothetical protein